MLEIYPFLTHDEFRSGCLELEGRSHDQLDTTDWGRVSWDEGGYLSIKQVGRRRDYGGSGVETKGGTETEVEVEVELDDDHDIDALVRPTPTRAFRPAIDFSIVLSPTYRVPVLYFRLADSNSIRLQDLEDIYECIVTSSSREVLRGTGVMGGISIANHPISDVPMFFIHPCNTSEAISAISSGKALNALQYLLVWMGIVGTVVGLHVPSRVAGSLH